MTSVKLTSLGFGKLLKQVDEKIAAKATQLVRPLTNKFVENHLNDVGLEPEFASHSRIGALSGGQKVKVVLAAAMWNTPHIIILDEPTNYLDRDSLGAMAEAINLYEGGVVIISHNAQFVDQVCPEVWHLENHTLNLKGSYDWLESANKEAAKVAKGRKVAKGVKALVVPGSQQVLAAAEAEGLHEIFIAAGFEWRGAGCSMCLAMNPDKLQGDQRCASSSNRNFKGRQGSPTGRTMLMSPAMVAAAAISGRVVDVRSLTN